MFSVLGDRKRRLVELDTGELVNEKEMQESGAVLAFFVH
jgi:hypothetical protein